MNSEIMEWAEDHKEKSSEDYDPYAHVWNADVIESGCQEILEGFDWEHDN